MEPFSGGPAFQSVPVVDKYLPGAASEDQAEPAAEPAAGLGRGQATAGKPPHKSIGHGPTEARPAAAAAAAVPAAVLGYHRPGS